MPYSPLISKIRCHNPNKKRTSLANKKSLEYIATRNGVDLSNIEDIIVYKEANDSQYLRYISKRPRSHGLFGNIDTTNLQEIKNLVTEVSEKHKCIYRGIISLSGKDAETLGYTNTKIWKSYLERVLPEVAKELGINMINFTWVAAYHDEKTHPHVHYMLWDNTDKIKSSYIHPTTQQKIRSNLSDVMFDEEYEKMIREVMRSELDEINVIRKETRRKLIENTKEFMQDIDSWVPGSNLDKIPDKISIEELKNLANEMNQLMNQLPVKGSLNYVYLSQDVKKQVNKILDLIMDRADMQSELAKYLKAVEDGNKLVGKTCTEIKRSKEQIKWDLKKRMANVIIKKAKYFRQFQNVNPYESIEKHDLEDKNLDEFILKGKEKNDSKQDFSETKVYQYLLKAAKQGNKKALLAIEKYDPTKKKEIVEEIKAANEKVQQVIKNINPESPIDEIYDKHFRNLYTKYLTSAAKNGNQFALTVLEEQFPQAGKEIRQEIYRNQKSMYIKYLTRAKKQGNEIAGKVLERIEAGKPLDQALNMHEEYIKQAAEQDNTFAAYQMGVIYMDPTNSNYNLEEGIRYITKAAELKDSFAQYRLGCELLKADSQYYDLEKGMNYIKLSAEQGNTFAEYKLGQIYLDIKSNCYDPEQGLQYLIRASKQENHLAEFMLGCEYFDSSKSYYNPEQGLEYLEKASNGEIKFAVYKLGVEYLKRDSKIFNPEQGIAYLKKAAEEEIYVAELKLGEEYCNKENPFYNIDNGIKYLTRAADRENPYAEYLLGKEYLNIENDTYDLVKGIDLLKKAGGHGNTWAEYALSKLYLDSNSILYDLEKGIEYVKRAANHGNSTAQFKLGYMYLTGVNVARNIKMGKELLMKSSMQGNTHAVQTLETFERYQRNAVIGEMYHMVKVLFNMIANSKEEQAWKNQKIRSNSKQALKEYYLREKNAKHYSLDRI